MRTISLRDANQGFSRFIREVEAGEEFVITRNGQPVARLVPAGTGRRKLTPAQQAAFERTMARMAHGWDLGGERVDRDALYDEAIKRKP